MRNDFVAVLPLPKAKGILVADADLDKLSNEGVVGGVGEEAITTCAIGDHVVFRSNKYPEFTPESGPYKGIRMRFIRKGDVYLVKSRIPEEQDIYKFVASNAPTQPAK